MSAVFNLTDLQRLLGMGGQQTQQAPQKTPEQLAQEQEAARLAALAAPVSISATGAGQPTAQTTAQPTAQTTSQPTTQTTSTGGSGIVIPDIPVEQHTPVKRIDPTEYEWTGTNADSEVIQRLRNRYDYEAPKRGTQMYGGYLGGINGTAPGLGYRNDNPIDYSAQGAGLVSQGIDPNDPALGYYVAAFKKNEPQNWSWAQGEYWSKNKRTGNPLVDDATVLDWYWRDLARRMDKSNSFFDSFIGQLFTNIAIGWATAGVGNLFGPWAGRIFGGIMGGLKSDWDPLKTIMGAASFDVGNLLDRSGITGIAKKVLPDWAEFVLPEPGVNFDYGLTDVAKSAAWTTAGEAFKRFQSSLQPQQAEETGPSPFEEGQTPASTTPPAPYVPPPSLPYEPIDFGDQGLLPIGGDQGLLPIGGDQGLPLPEEGQGTSPPTSPFDPNNNPYNPITGFAAGGMAKRRKPATESQAMYQDLMRQRQQEEMPPEQMTHEDFINYATRRLPMASLVKA